jgi:arsenate reductase
MRARLLHAAVQLPGQAQMNSLKRLLTFQLLLTVSLVQGCQSSPARPAIEPAPVLMVCEHGSVKSLMAASLFNQRAAERHLPFRAIARGITPDPAVPAPIAAALKQEGLDVTGFVPSRASATDVSQALRVVAIGVDPTVLSPGANVAVDTWSDVPAASENYGAAHASLEQHVDALLTELQQSGKR